MSRRVALILLVVVAGFVGCRCGRKPDEEILKERIATTSVELYLATKIAVLKADQSPEAKAASEQLVSVLDALQGKSPAGATGTSTVELGPADYLKLAKALYALREEGKRLLESGNEGGLAPVLPKLFPKGDPALDALAATLDLNTEHALLLTAMFVLKLHPKAPVPLPEEILLYEAWMTEAAKVKFPGVGPMAASIKAVVYGTNELCDLAKKEADSAERQAKELKGGELGKTATDLFGPSAGLDPKQAAEMIAGVRAVAHGATGSCYLQRDEKDKALPELDELVKAATELGVPPGETATLRAYLAYERKDYAAAESALVEARDYPQTDPQTKKDVEELIGYVRAKKESKVRGYFSQGFIALYGAKMVIRHLDEAGAFEPIKQSEPAKVIDRYVTAAGKAVDALPSVDDAKSAGKKLLDKVKP